MATSVNTLIDFSKLSTQTSTGYGKEKKKTFPETILTFPIKWSMFVLIKEGQYTTARSKSFSSVTSGVKLLRWR